MAEDCLAVALSFYVDRSEDIPAPSPLADGQVLIAVPLIVAAKLTLYTAMREHGITDADLAAMLGMDKTPSKGCSTPIVSLTSAKSSARSRQLGRSLIVEDVVAV